SVVVDFTVFLLFLPCVFFFFFFSSRRRHTRFSRDWSSDVCSSDLSGYLYTEAEHAASHAWADVWLADVGWTSIDITNRQFASECHCRLAVARDYDSASPVRGVRHGGGEESMTVSVQVQTAGQQ